ncbi:MAG: hypothetical protein K2J12_02360 [Muribaculaceae bacterium]|nr:hypothetical protein [Muribaculaceae bacterium]
MRTIFIMLLLAVSFTTVDGQNNNFKQKLAVYMIGDIDEAYKKVIGSKMVSEIAASPDYIAIERTNDFLNAISSEQDYQVSGNVSDSQIAKIGQQFGVRYVAVVDANELLDEIFVSSRLIDVQSAVIVYSFDTSSPVQNMNHLVSLSQKVAEGLIIKPKEEERARIKSEEERIEREKREQIERTRREELAAREEAERREQFKRSQLRNQAIQNLLNKLGVSTFQVAGYIIRNDVYDFRFEFDAAKGKVVIANPIPYGWEMADETILRAISNNRLKNFDIPGLYFVVPGASPVRGSNYNRSKELGNWEIQVYSGSNLYYRRRIIGDTIKQKGSKIPVFSSNLNSFTTFLCRPFFSESEIQAEINRIQ